MKKLFFLIAGIFTILQAGAQVKNAAQVKDNTLPGLQRSIVMAQESMGLFAENLGTNTKEQDVNTIILDIEKYIDSLHGTRSKSDALLNKYFAPLRLYFLTTTNKTTVATMFLYGDAPYRFCRYGDSGVALHIGAIKNGNVYNIAKVTEKRAAKTAMETCLLPAMKAFEEFKEGEIKYMALSIYYGCKDSREGAPQAAITTYCMTLVARLTDIQQYNAGLITAKGLLAVAEVYLSDIDDAHELRRVQVGVE